MRKGDRVYIFGDSNELWIEDYNVRVSTEATIEETPDKNAKKVLVTLDEIDGDHNVCCLVRKSKIEDYDDCKYRIHKQNIGELEVLPYTMETPIWKDFDNADCDKNTRTIAALYRAIEERENYYQFNSPTAFGNPDYSMKCGIVVGLLMGAGMEEDIRNDKIIIRKGEKKILVIDKVKRPQHYYEAKIQERLRRSIELLRNVKINNI